MFGKRLTFGGLQSLRGQFRPLHGMNRVGGRELVGHGCNGIACYTDNAHFPFPSIRFMENSPQILALRKKEEGDWKALSIEEKKTLYRASFCQTFAEFQHPTGQWKFILGGVLFLTSFAFWMQIFFNNFVHTPRPSSLSPRSQRAQLRRMLGLHVNPIDGLASQWDYDNDCWKSETKHKVAPPTEPETVVPPSDKKTLPAVPCGCGCGAATPICQCDE